MIKWGKLPPGGSAISGYLFEGLLQCLVWYDSELAGFKVKFRGPDGISKTLPELFGDTKQAKHAAESYIRQLVKLDAQPGFGCMAITLTGPENELLGHATIDLLNPIFNTDPNSESHLIETIATQARILAHLWLARQKEVTKPKRINKALQDFMKGKTDD